MDINDIIVDEESTLIEAMNALDRMAKKILFVTRDGELAAALTDGDIRRWILKKGNLDAKVKDMANYKPISIPVSDKAFAKDIMKKKSIEALPIVDENMRLCSVVFWNDEEIASPKKIDLPVVIMAGGIGSRLYPYTKILPKPLIPIGELPIAEHIINRFHEYGCEDFYLVVNHKKNMIKSYFNEIERDYKITYVDEERPLGTAGGLSLLKGMIDGTFILSNCDILVIENYEKICKYHKQQGNLITMICSLKKFTIPYGVIEIGENGEIEKMKEKPELSFFTNTGVYIVESKVIDEMVDNQMTGFPDVIAKYKDMNGKIGIYPISENAWMDMGHLEGIEDMKRRYEYHE